MQTTRSMIFGAVLSLTLGFLATGTSAADPIPKDDPLKMLQAATEQVLQIAIDTQKQPERDTAAYYTRIDAVLMQIIDLEYFTRGVMATHASAKRYKTLTTEEERRAFRERIDRFGKVLKDSLMASYADALLAFDGERITWEPAPANAANPNEVLLTQVVHAKSGKEYRVQYRVRKTEKSGWLVQNLVVEGLNMGEAYRNQFAAAVEQNKGNVDYVVENWPRLMSKVTPET
jgi:phospholipid transport system substrate-binding protein